MDMGRRGRRGKSLLISIDLAYPPGDLAGATPVSANEFIFQAITSYHLPANENSS
jgi:hypothetical protein